MLLTLQAVKDQATDQNFRQIALTLSNIAAPRSVRGYINSAGGVLAGSGFTVSKPEALRYKVTFAVPFKGYPVVTFSPAAGGNIAGNLIAIEPSFFELDLYNTANTRTAGFFTFIAMEQ